MSCKTRLEHERRSVLSQNITVTNHPVLPLYRKHGREKTIRILRYTTLKKKVDIQKTTAGATRIPYVGDDPTAMTRTIGWLLINGVIGTEVQAALGR